jgi:hypothetical protein
MTHAKTRVLVRALLAAAFALPLCLSSLSAQEKPREDEDAKTPSEDALTRALQRRLAGKQSLDDVMIDVRWRFENEFASARLFGDGVGAWNRSVGFRVPRAQAKALIAKFAAARFGSLPDSAGDEESRSLTGRIIVSAGAVRKSIEQMADGPQSPVLSGLAESLMRLSKKAAADGGVRVSSFEDGFAAQSSGKLGPGALELRFFRRPQPGGSPSPGAWELRINGAYFYVRNLGGAGSPDSTWQLHLSSADFNALVGELSKIQIGTLPVNLYAPIYTDLEISLLNQRKNIQARQFAGMTPQTHGERQEAFDRFEKLLETLRERVLKQGKKVEAVGLVGPPREEHEKEREKEPESEKD